MPLMILTVSSSFGGGTFTDWKRRSSERSFSMDLRYSPGVVAPMHWISPRERAGLRMLAASSEPSAEPAPPSVCSSSIKMTQFWFSINSFMMVNQNCVIFIDELHTLVGAGSAEGSLDAANILKPALSRGEIQCIGATTPGEYRKSIEKDRSLERRFQSVKVPPPNEEETVTIITGIKERYEKFHAVSYTADAIQFAVYHSNRYIPDRFLPDKAIDLLDEAGARVKLRQTSLPEDITEVQKRIKFILHRMENAIANHEFEKARFYSDEERKERENLRGLREKYHLDESSTGVVGREDIEDVVSRWTGVPITSIKEEETQRLLRIEEELHKRII